MNNKDNESNDIYDINSFIKGAIWKERLKIWIPGILICLVICLPLKNVADKINAVINTQAVEIDLLSHRVSELENHYPKNGITNVNNGLFELNEKITTLGSTVNDLSNMLPDVAYLVPGEKAYSQLYTSGGFLSIRMGAISKYASGYKVHIEIGNPQLTIYDDMKMAIKWSSVPNAKWDDKETELWKQSVKSKTVTLNNSILPGRWTDQEIILPDTSAKQLGIIAISLIPQKEKFLK